MDRSCSATGHSVLFAFPLHDTIIAAIVHRCLQLSQNMLRVAVDMCQACTWCQAQDLHLAWRFLMHCNRSACQHSWCMQLLKTDARNWTSKYARGGSVRKPSARKIYIVVDALQGHITSNGYAAFWQTCLLTLLDAMHSK